MSKNNSKNHKKSHLMPFQFINSNSIRWSSMNLTVLSVATTTKKNFFVTIKLFTFLFTVHKMCTDGWKCPQEIYFFNEYPNLYCVRIMNWYHFIIHDFRMCIKWAYFSHPLDHSKIFLVFGLGSWGCLIWISGLGVIHKLRHALVRGLKNLWQSKHKKFLSLGEGGRSKK